MAKKYNWYLENINMNFNDTYVDYYYKKNIREYLYYDEYRRIIDIREYKSLIFNENYYFYLRAKYRYFKHKNRR